MTTTTTKITHLGVTTDLRTWQLLGYRESRYREDAPIEAESVYTHLDRESNAKLDSLIVRGKAATGSTDGDIVIGWALSEVTRQAEEKTRSTAIAREAESLAALARAIKESEKQAIIEQIIGRLSERTQYAVRKQLGITAD